MKEKVIEIRSMYGFGAFQVSMIDESNDSVSLRALEGNVVANCTVSLKSLRSAVGLDNVVALVEERQKALRELERLQAECRRVRQLWDEFQGASHSEDRDVFMAKSNLGYKIMELSEP